MLVQKKQLLLISLLCVFLLALGLMPAQAEGAQISGMAWLDKTVDGLCNNESGLADVKITLEKKNADGSVSALASVETQRDGSFAFSVSAAGEYRLSVEAPEDYQFTLHGQGSKALPAQGNRSVTPYFSVQDGDFVTQNIGLTKSTSYISFYAFEDENANGGRMLSEALIRDVLVELLYEYEGETYLIASGTTNRNGELSLRDLSAGTYRVRATLPDENYVMGPLGEKINGYYNCIVAGEGNTGLSEPVTLGAKDSFAMGIGAVRTGSVTGKIWYDANYNGAWDKDESGLTSALITLSSNSIDLTRETYADASGAFAFRGMQPGSYQLIVTLPDGMIFTYPGTSLISDIATKGEVNVSIQVETTTNIKPIGAMPATSLTVSLYEDANLNGVQDAGEAPVPGAKISASQGGKIVETVYTGEASGSAHFATLRGGDTVIDCILPDGYIFTISDDSLISVSSAQSSASASVLLDGEAENAAYSIGVTRPAAISGMLFEDPANTGLYNEGYTLLPGFTVQALNENGEIALETKTDDNGEYTLYPLYPGDYTVRFLLADPYIAAPYAADQANNANSIYDQTPDYGECMLIALKPDDSVSSVNGAVFRAGIIQGRVLLNANHDSLATNEGGMEGVTVTLLDEFGAPISDYSYSISDANGDFMIKGVEPGTYSLVYSLPADCAFAFPMTDLTEVASAAFAIESGSVIQLADVGVVKTSTISGKILHLDTPVAATIRLAAQKFGTVYETNTLEDGQYIISGLRPDTYEVTVTLPEGYVFGDNGVSPVPAVAGHTSTAVLTFAMGDMALDADISAALPASLSGVIFYDVNSSCVMDADEMADAGRDYSLWLHDQCIASGVTDENGAFAVSQLVPGTYTLRLPLTSQEIMIGDARQENGEWAVDITVGDGENLTGHPVPVLRYASISGAVWSLDGTFNGVSNVQLALLDMYGNILSLTNTDAMGAFTFGNLLPGNYAISAVLPEGYMFARAQDAINRASYVQSMPDGTAQALLIQLPMGENVIGVDIGIGALGAIGDRAWLDENGNGMQDIGEPDMPGIVIELYQYDQLIASATTDYYGRYAITNLYPGEYQMKVTMHAELKTTAQQTEFPLVASILPQSDDTVVIAPSVIVPSGGENLHCDLGFQLRKANQYPAIMDEIPEKDWRPYSER